MAPNTARPTWFGGDQPAWAYGGGQERPQWVADWLPGLCEGLHATGSAGAAELSRDGAPGDAGFGDMAADCAARLRARLAAGPSRRSAAPIRV